MSLFVLFNGDIENIYLYIFFDVRIGYFLLLCLLYNTKCCIVIYYVICLFIYLDLKAKMLDVMVAVTEADVIAILLIFKAMNEVPEFRELCFIDGSWCYRTMSCFGSWC